jgi:hypothetical protein
MGDSQRGSGVVIGSSTSSSPPIKFSTNQVYCTSRKIGTRPPMKWLLSVKTHRRAAIDNMRSREAPGTAGVPRSLSQRPRIWHMTWRLGLLGVPPDLVLDQEGVDVVSVSFRMHRHV